MYISIISRTTTNHQEEPPVRVVLSLSLSIVQLRRIPYILMLPVTSGRPSMKGGVGGGGGGGWSPIDRGERGRGQRNLKVILTSREGRREDTEKVGTNRRIVTQSRL